VSLRKSPQLTPELLAAARQNVQHSTGPRSPEALGSDISSRIIQSAEVMEGRKMNEQSGYVYENKGPLWKTGAEAGMSMKKMDLAH
jgi:hypothetical protein